MVPSIILVRPCLRQLQTLQNGDEASPMPLRGRIPAGLCQTPAQADGRVEQLRHLFVPLLTG